MATSVFTYQKISVLIILWLCSFTYVQAQLTQDTTSNQNIIEKNVKVTGEVGAYGELYGISGRDSRRPSSTGRLFLRPTLTFLNQLSLNFNILLSTEGISARQNISQLGLDPSWNWGDAHVGDFSESFSKYTLDGITIRGGGVNLYPGKVRLSAVVGRSNRAVQGGATNKSYKRNIWGVKAGFGEQSKSFVDLILVKASDQVGSLPPDSIIAPSPDSLLADTAVIGNAPPRNPFAVTPQENVVAGIQWRWTLFDRKLTWESQVNGSMFTRDKRSSAVDISELGVPDFASDLYTPRFSSSADFVVDTKVNLNFSKVTISSGYKWIGPGYTSLGTSYLINDQRAFSTNATFRISGSSINVNWARINDNLLDQKRFTSVQNRLGGSFTTRFSQNWNSTVSANLVTRGNDADSDSARADFDNLVLTTNQNFTLSREKGLQNITINYSFQSANTQTGIRFENTSRTHTVNSQARIQFRENLHSTLSVGLVSSQPSDSVTNVIQTYGLSLRHSAFDDKLSNSLSFKTSARENNLNFRTRLQSSYRISEKDMISLSLSMTNFRGESVSRSPDFNEFIGSLRITHRF